MIGHSGNYLSNQRVVEYSTCYYELQILTAEETEDMDHVMLFDGLGYFSLWVKIMSNGSNFKCSLKIVVSIVPFDVAVVGRILYKPPNSTLASHVGTGTVLHQGIVLNYILPNVLSMG